jgi:NhaA family Na+:H+ antiporter
MAFWEQKISISVPPIEMPATLIHLVNDLLMSIFFFTAGLEIKREITTGQLNTFKRALMPIISAAGGMFFPAIIYLVWCHGKSNYMGWGIPVATDIAFSLGVLSLLGKRTPVALKIFLTAIAIIDDIGGIITIAIFYAGQLHWTSLIIAILIIAALIAISAVRKIRLGTYLMAGIWLWYFVYHSGIHATIAGVIMAFLIPIEYNHRLEHMLRIPVNFVILPLFALANTAIILPADMIAALNSRIQYAVLTGLVIGKPAGIFIFTWLADKMKVATMPTGINRKQLLGVGIIAGIGFTVSMFIATLAFQDRESQLVAKIGVINASFISGIAGYLFLRTNGKKKTRQKAGYEE